MPLARVCDHHGEEPPISGTTGAGNVFLAGCNLRCRFCQNWQISQDGEPTRFDCTPGEAAARIRDLVTRRRPENIAFVSPSHACVQMLQVITELADVDRPLVYNSNGYDALDVLEHLDGVVDIYLPDLKYGDGAQADHLSSAPDYTARACAAIEEMVRQVGFLETDANGIARRGVLVRHLVLPNRLADTAWVLGWLRDTFGPRVPVSLMAQYYPTHRSREDPLLSRTLGNGEIARVLNELDRRGLEAGWTQDLRASDHYRPDFDTDGHPFRPTPDNS